VSEFGNPEIYRAILESLQTGVYLVGPDQKILFWNDGAEKITGYLRHEVVGSFCRENLLGCGYGNKNVLADAADALASVLRDGKPTISHVSLRHKAGHRIFVRLRAVAIRNGHGTIIGAAESFEESLSASDWDRRRSKLASYGCLDPVAGTLSEKFILSRLRADLTMIEEHLMPSSILCVEVDGMDKLRSKYGLAVVGTVLHVVAQTIENTLRPTDFLGRFGEKRFLAILTECGPADVAKPAERLKKMVEFSEVEWWGDRWSVTASFGGTNVKPGDTVESVLERAEQSLNESLAGGGNRVTVAAV
jgi:diguanylate cyclase (GGDEF)-like protein/PAS domain S-box-containing protein